MPGSAVIGNNLVDSLVGVVDDLRGDLHPAMGVRHWRVYTVRRTWPSGEVDEGTYTDVETEIDPQPLVSQDLRNQLTPAGLVEDGVVTLSEVSLSYTEAQLTGRPVLPGQQWFYVLREAHGQATMPRYYGLKELPYPDRLTTIGWILKLTRQKIEDC